MMGYYLNRLAIVLASMVFVPLASLLEAANPHSLFDQLDQNRDGWITRDEMSEQRMFDRLLRTSDGDGDHRLSSEELVSGLKPKKPAKPILEKQDGNLPGADALVVLLNLLNTNGDGRIEPGEVPEAYRTLFDRILQQADGDHSGELDRRELIQAAPRLARVAKQVATRRGIDVNKELAKIPESSPSLTSRQDKRSALGQLLANPRKARQLFTRLDADGDGLLTVQEIPEPFQQRLKRLLKKAGRQGIVQGGVRKISQSQWQDLARQLVDQINSPDKSGKRSRDQ